MASAGGASPAGTLNTDAVLERWLASQANVRTWSAKLTQTRRLKTLKQPLISTGRVWFAAPRQFRWELGDPAQTIAVRAESELIVAYPRLQRAEVYPLDAASTGPWKAALDLFEAGFPRDRKDLESRFKVVGVEAIERGAQIRMTPRDSTARRLIAVLRVETDTNTGALLATEIEFADGSTLRNDFESALMNLEIDPGRFQFSIPEGFAITRPGGKP